MIELKKYKCHRIPRTKNFVKFRGVSQFEFYEMWKTVHENYDGFQVSSFFEEWSKQFNLL